MRRNRSLSLAAEPLERRHPLAVNAFVDTVSGQLLIQFGEDGDQATLTVADPAASTAPAQLIYQVTGTGLTAPATFEAAAVSGISVTGSAGSQSLLIADAGQLGVGHPLKVDDAVEKTAVYGRIDSPGIVLVKSAEIVLGNSVRSAGEQVYLGQVLLDGDVVVDAGTAAVRFMATLDGIGDGRFQHGATGNLEIRAGGETFFGGPVGGRLGLAGLSTDALGETTIAGGTVVTNGPQGQSFLDAVTFVANTVAGTNVILNAGGGPIVFASSLNGAVAVTSSTSGTTEFRGPVGSVTPLLSLDTDARGTTKLGGGLDASSVVVGTADFKNAVTLAAPATLTVDKLRFGRSVDGGHPLFIAAGQGNVDFVGTVGGGEALAGLAITSAGSVSAKAPISLVGTDANAATDGIMIGPGVQSATFAAGGSISGFRGAGVVFGGTSLGSTISGFDIRSNGGHGILVNPGDYAGTVIAGNTIADNGGPATTAPLGGSTFTRDAGDGILVMGSHLLVGGAGQAGNVIRGNLRSGITVRGATAVGNTILGNSIFLNGAGPPATVAAGIRLLDGGNADQATPTIEAVGIDYLANVVRARVSIPGGNGRTFQVQIFGNVQADVSGTTPVDPMVFQGRTLLGTGTVVGTVPTLLEMPLSTVLEGDWLTATATATDVGSSTSAFSVAAQVAAPNTVATAVTPPAAGHYRAGDVLTFTVRFAVPVVVTGVPALPLTIGTTPLQAAYTGGSGTTSLLFRHTVHAGEAGGVLLGEAFSFDGGTIRDDLNIPVSAKVPFTNTEGIVVDDNPGVVFAAATAGSSVAWDREFVYSAVNATTIRVSGLPAAQAGYFLARTPLTITPAAAGESQAVTVVRSSYNARQRSVVVTLSRAIPTPAGGGTLVLGSAAVPGARLIEAGTGSQQREFGAADLAHAGYSNAFVTRFQGGLRAVAADVNGNGRADLVVAPGGVPDRPDPAAPHQKLARVFGTSLSTIAIFDGAVTPAWDPVSIDVGGVFTGGARDGYFVALGDCVDDAPGSGVMELVVAAGGRVAVFDLLVAEQGERPTINPVPVRVTDLPSGQAITSLTVGRLFATGGHDDIVIAATTASQRDAGTTRVTILAGSTLDTTRSFVVSSLVESGPSRRLVDVFGFGASVGVGDIDGDDRADLVLGAGANGLANFRVLGNEFVIAASAITNPASFAATIAEQLGPRGRFAQAPRQGRGWRPTGGPDFFTPGEVIGPTGMGFNAPLSVVVVNGLPSANGRALVFAALGGSNQTANTVRRFLFNGTNAWTADALIDLLPVTPGNPRFRYGGGVRLG